MTPREEPLTDLVTHALYPSPRYHEIVRRQLIGRLGIPERKIITRHRDTNLTTGTQATELFNLLLEGDPEAFVLLAFPGRLGGTGRREDTGEDWTELVSQIFESVIMKMPSRKGKEAAMSSVKEILRRINGSRMRFSMDRDHGFKGEQTEVLKDIEPIPNEILEEVRRRVILVMLSSGDDYIEAGKLAKEIGVIDLAYDPDFLATQTHIVREELDRAIGLRTHLR